MENVTLAGLNIQGYSQGGVQSSMRIPELNSTFDIGVELRQTEFYFLTHGHHDHFSAFSSIVGRRWHGTARFHVPAPIFPQVKALLEALRVVYGEEELRIELTPLSVGNTVTVDKGLTVRAVENFHVVPSLGYIAERTRQKLKAEFVDRPGSEIAGLRKAGVSITDSVTSPIFALSGDSRIEFLDNPEVQKAKVLFHDVTFWDSKTTVESTRAYGHTHVDEMIQNCEKFEGEVLVLIHRSKKHTRKECENVVQTRFPESMRSKIVLFDGESI